MTHIYLGNGTKQNLQFAYRIPERKGVIVQPVPIGSQVLLAPNGSYNTHLNPHEVESILAQCSQYGIVNIADLDITREPFTGLCYSLDKPISSEKLSRAMRKEEERLDAIGIEMRKEAAVAVNQQLETHIGPLRGLEMSVAEIEPTSGFRDDGRVKHVAEGIRVSREETPRYTPAAPSRARRRK